MSNSENGPRVAGSWLAIGGVLLAGALVFHGPPSPVMTEQMQIIADGSMRWSAVHWAAAAALSAFAIAGLIVLTSGSRLTAVWTTMTAWAVLTVGALWTLTTAVAEATAIAHIAPTGDETLFAAWWEFAEGKANGFAFLALATAAIAANEVRSPERVVPPWAAWVGAVVAVLSFVGWVVGSWIGIGIGGLIWLASSLVMCLWLVWFGIGLARAEVESAREQPSPART